MNRGLVAAAAAMVLAGCTTTRVVSIPVAFDDAQAERQLAGGANTITGSALLRQRGGGVVTCAGGEVVLIPATEYAKYRIAGIYGSRKLVTPSLEQLKFSPDVPGYYSRTARTTCNAQGFFKFDRVADGDFFVQTVITWSTGRYDTQGGSVIGRVAVQGGQTAEITLTQ